MAERGPRFRRFGRCGPGPCLYVVLALVTPAVAGAPAPTSRTRWRPGSARPRRGRPLIRRRGSPGTSTAAGRSTTFLRAAATSRASSTTPPANLLCRPDGGFVDGDQRCPDFFAERRGGEIVWSTRAGPERSVHARSRVGSARPARPMIGFAPCARSTVARRATAGRPGTEVGAAAAAPGLTRAASTSPARLQSIPAGNPHVRWPATLELEAGDDPEAGRLTR